MSLCPVVPDDWDGEPERPCSIDYPHPGVPHSFESRGTFACPICGVETPHGHTDGEIQEHKLRRAFEDLYARKVGGLELDYPGSSTGTFVGSDARMEPLRVSGYGLRWMWSQRTTEGYREPKIQALWLFFVASHAEPVHG